jgi:hypothetical protein
LCTLAAFVDAGFAVFMVLGAGFTAIVLAVTHDRVFTEFTVAFRAVAGTVIHKSDSVVRVVRVPRMRDT